ncbi:hypothetical protein BDF19DRAFT_452367 [Syncephalis fuscata]|nr:hypothetical protein BDF19DRAFT_452367 [Syncephalis fuscata]
MGRNRNYNPVEAHRKAQHKREIKKNKEERRKQRESKLETANLTELKEQVAHYSALESNDRLDAASRKKLEQSKSRLQKATKIQQEIRQNRPRQPGSTASSTADPTIPKDPTRSIYYHPTLNPFGVPPPGQPYREIDDIEPTPSEQSVENDSNGESGSDNSDDSGSESDADDMPELPPDSPPSNAGSDQEQLSDNEDDLPDLPEGTPPPLPSELENTTTATATAPFRPPFNPNYPPPFVGKLTKLILI